MASSMRLFWKRFRSSRLRFAALALVITLPLWAYWYDQHRTIGWTDTVNPMFWWRRIRGEDIYDADHAFLMRGNHDLPEIALTFDDGPHPQSRARILDTLKEFGAKATFFDVGRRVEERPDLVLRTLAEGHEIANHSTNHNRLPPLSPELRHREINDADIFYYSVAGQHLTLLRPPGMNYDEATLAETKRLGYIVVGYTTLTGDSDISESAQDIAARSVRRSGNGSIILLHDYAPTADALPTILRQLQAKGYHFVTISEMISHLPPKAREQARAFQEGKGKREKGKE